MADARCTPSPLESCLKEQRSEAMERCKEKLDLCQKSLVRARVRVSPNPNPNPNPNRNRNPNPNPNPRPSPNHNPNPN